jgi:transposase
MANELKMAIVNTITELLEKGWKQRRIARELGVNRETVARYARLRLESGPKPANPTLGSEGPPSPKPANPTAGFLSGPASLCDPFRETITQKLEQGLEGVRIWQDLVSEKGFAGSYSSVKRFLRRLCPAQGLPFRRMECPPGEEAQVDFGTGAWTLVDGKKRRPYVFRIVLSYSRKAYSESVWRQTTENFIRCLENAFRSFGGVPKTLVIDNLRAAVSRADWFDPELNPKISDFARHYGIVILPTKPYTPRHKGKVENSVKYVQNNAIKGRTFESLVEQNAFLSHWESQIADTRIHGTTRQQVRKLFEIERTSLQKLSLEPFPIFDEGRRSVHRDGHVEVAKAYYSVPPEYLGHKLWARWDLRMVRIYDTELNQVAVHCRVLPGRFHTLREHLDDKKISAVERGAEFLLVKAFRIGPSVGRWAKAMLDVRGVEGIRVIQGLLSIAVNQPVAVLERATAYALNFGCFRLRSLRELCQRFANQQIPAGFIQEDPLIRPLSEYQDLLRVSFSPGKTEESDLRRSESEKNGKMENSLHTNAITDTISDSNDVGHDRQIKNSKTTQLKKGFSFHPTHNP